MWKAAWIAAVAATVALGGAGAKPRNHAALAEGGYVLPPIAFTKFCLDYPSECAGAAARVQMDAERMQALEDVNRQVNGSITPTRDASRFHFWALNVAQGDCNNYAIQKRHELIQRGWPAGALALSVVRTSWGEGHLVVTVRSDAGDYVLDNLRADVVDWRRAGYQWVMRQSARNPQFWVALGGGRPADDEDRAASAARAEPPVAAPAAPSVVHLGRSLTLGMASLPAYAEPLTLKPEAGELALFALPQAVEGGWPDATLALADPARSAAWALRGSLDAPPPA